MTFLIRLLSMREGAAVLKGPKSCKGKQGKEMGRFSRRVSLLPALLLAIMLGVTGCGRVVFVTGLDLDELFTVGDQKGSCRELRVYLLTMENQYKETYGEDVFTRAGNETLEESLKENALERLVKVKALNQMAARQDVALEETEISSAAQKAGQYMDSLTEADRSYLKITGSDAQNMFREYTLAAKMAEQMTAGVSREVSDDEARTVTVQSILIKTYTTGADGSRQEFSDQEKAQAKARAEAIRQEIQDGMDNLLGITFAEYIAKYNEDSTSTCTLSGTASDTAFAQAAFNQPVGTISDVVETADGYRIIKPIATSDEAQLESSKEAILEARLQDAYEAAYDENAEQLDCQLTESRWSQVKLCEDLEAVSDNFFALCAEDS